MSQQQPEQQAPSPDEIREDIEETREELGDTAAALAAKTDVKSRAKAKVESVKESAQQRKDEFAGKAKEATPESVGGAAHQAAGVAQENPLPLAIGAAFVAGMVVGRLLSR
jgi:ElaB/YqjD/DUF883 family membrane-anchored ribosome-binding protein